MSWESKIRKANKAWKSPQIRTFNVNLRLFNFSQNSETEHQLAEGESLTDYKMKNLGTREEVQNSFQRELNQHRNQGQGEIILEWEHH